MSIIENPAFFNQREEIQLIASVLREYIHDRLRDPQNLSITDRHKRAFLLGIIDKCEKEDAALAELEQTLANNVRGVEESVEDDSVQTDTPTEDAAFVNTPPPPLPPSAPPTTTSSSTPIRRSIKRSR